MLRDPLDDNNCRLYNDHSCATMDECVHRQLFVARSAAMQASYGAKTTDKTKIVYRARGS